MVMALTRAQWRAGRLPYLVPIFAFRLRGRGMQPVAGRSYTTGNRAAYCPGSWRGKRTIKVVPSSAEELTVIVP